MFFYPTTFSFISSRSSYLCSDIIAMIRFRHETPCTFNNIAKTWQMTPKLTSNFHLSDAHIFLRTFFLLFAGFFFFVFFIMCTVLGIFLYFLVFAFLLYTFFNIIIVIRKKLKFSGTRKIIYF